MKQVLTSLPSLPPSHSHSQSPKLWNPSSCSLEEQKTRPQGCLFPGFRTGQRVDIQLYTSRSSRFKGFPDEPADADSAKAGDTDPALLWQATNISTLADTEALVHMEVDMQTLIQASSPPHILLQLTHAQDGQPDASDAHATEWHAVCARVSDQARAVPRSAQLDL